MNNKLNFILLPVLAFTWLPACKKFLAKTPNITLVGPSSIADYRALLDNNLVTVNSTPGLGPLAVNDYIVDSAIWSGEDLVSKGVYIWDPNTYQEGPISASWGNPYLAINTCNIVLNGMDQLKNIDHTNQAAYNATYGSALFYRAFFFYNLEETYGQPYQPGIAAANPDGVLLRLGSDPLQKLGRSSVAQVYDQIIKDLKAAIPLLPSGVQTLHNRPGLPAALALLARVYLSEQDYTSALYWSDSCLRTYHTLVDYNTVKETSHPFLDSENSEILFQCSANDYLAPYTGLLQVDTTLYGSYTPNDLRRTLFFQPMQSGKGVFFKGNYTGGLYLFSGLAVDEVYLIRSESNAQLGFLSAAINDLNSLLSFRWKTGTFSPYSSALPADSVLRLVWNEKRKETLFREGRWFDLRRLNQDPRYALTLKRTLGSRPYTLPPNDHRYTFLIPASEVELSGINQNPIP